MAADEAKAKEVAPEAAAELNELTGKDHFNEEVFKTSSFVMFYAPWCGACKAVKPHWAEISKMELDNKGVYAVNCTAPENEEVCADFGVGSFPTIKYTPDGGVTWEDYKGGRSLDDLKKHLEEMPVELCNLDMKDGCSPMQLEMMKMSDEEKNQKIKDLGPDYRRENLSPDLKISLLDKLVPILPSKPTQPEPTQPEPTQPEPTQPEPTKPEGSGDGATGKMKESVVKALKQASSLIEEAGSLLSKLA